MYFTTAVRYTTGSDMEMKSKETILTRVERHIIKRADKNYSKIKDICHKCKNIYNYTNYIIRQHFFKHGELPDGYELVKRLAKENQEDYRALPAPTSQQVIRLLYGNWGSYFKAIRAYIGEEMKHHSKYAGRRIHRGLFKSSTGVLVNADVNGALGIMRKVFPEKADALAKLIRNSGVVFTPVIVNSINCHVANTKATNNHISFCTTKKVS